MKLFFQKSGGAGAPTVNLLKGQKLQSSYRERKEKDETLH
jgi:hypothetical protein